MNIYSVVLSHFSTTFQVSLNVVVGEFLHLLAEVRLLLYEALGLDQIRRMQVAIFVKVEHPKHELRFHDRSWLKEWYVEVIDELVEVDSFVFLSIRKKMVKALVK